MMKKLVAGCFALGALVAAQSAVAADLSVAPLYTKAPPPAEVTQAYNWTGLYLGANGGGGWGRSWWSGSATPVDLSGAQVGGTAGYNWQFGNTVLGLEGDGLVDLKGSSTTGCAAGCTTENDWLSTVRGRVGYAFGGILPYVTGGLAVGDINASTPGFAGAHDHAGWTVGGGLEFALPGNWSAKAEYLHVDPAGLIAAPTAAWRRPTMSRCTTTSCAPG